MTLWLMAAFSCAVCIAFAVAIAASLAVLEAFCRALSRFASAIISETKA